MSAIYTNSSLPNALVLNFNVSISELAVEC